jgi:hypothetical protein
MQREPYHIALVGLNSRHRLDTLKLLMAMDGENGSRVSKEHAQAQLLYDHIRENPFV